MRIPLSQLEAAIASNDYRGFCLACGEGNDGGEPEAQESICHACGYQDPQRQQLVHLQAVCDSLAAAIMQVEAETLALQQGPRL